MIKLKITSKQYNTILLREQKSRLATNTVQINESLGSDTELIEEGLKEVLLGVASLLGVKLSGINQSLAQDALNSDSTMSEIKSTFEDEDKTKELVKSFEEKGMKNPDILMAKNAKKIVDKFNKISSENKLTYHLSEKAVNNIESLSKELVREKESEKAKNEKTKSILVKDVIKVKFSTDKAFAGGNYVLNSAGVNAISSIVDGIKNAGGSIVSVKIESSTDAELSKKHKSQEDPTGNIKLATLRTKNIADFLENTDDKIHITHREIPNNGSDIVSHKQFLETEKDEESLAKLKRKTAEFRYIELTITVDIEGSVQENTQPEEFVKDYRLKLKTAFVTDKVSLEKDSVISYPNKKVKCGVSNKKVSCITI